LAAALAVVLLPVAVAACGCENGCWTKFSNLTDVTVQFIRVSSDGRESRIELPVKPGGSSTFGWDNAFSLDCKDGAWVARSEVDGTEVARWDRPGKDGGCPMFWGVGGESTMFVNYTGSTVQVVSVDRNGRETLAGDPIKPGDPAETQWRDFAADCPNGAWIARSVPEGREIARWDGPAKQNGDVGPCPTQWRILPPAAAPSSSG
jgi:hypothetical protein